jgi:hypothetical protein
MLERDSLCASEQASGANIVAFQTRPTNGRFISITSSPEYMEATVD